jgi:hypothetical protein
MTQQPEEADDAAINALINATPVINTRQADMDDAMIRRFMQDVAYAIQTTDDIARRWGLEDEAGLRAYLKRNPKMVTKIAELRAVHESDASIEDRNKLKANHGVEMVLGDIVNMALDPKLKPVERLDAFKSLQKQAGLDKVEGKGAVAAQAFSVTINLPGRAPINTTVVPTIEGDA